MVWLTSGCISTSSSFVKNLWQKMQLPADCDHKQECKCEHVQTLSCAIDWSKQCSIRYPEVKETYRNNCKIASLCGQLLWRQTLMSLWLASRLKQELSAEDIELAEDSVAVITVPLCKFLLKFGTDSSRCHATELVKVITISGPVCSLGSHTIWRRPSHCEVIHIPKEWFSHKP